MTGNGLLAFVNGRVLAGEDFASDCAVLIDGMQIIDIVADSDPHLNRAQRHDLGGDYLVPGFIDCQVNGGGGILFNDAPYVDTLRRIGAAHSQFGTTGFLPTLISDDRCVMRSAISAADAAIASRVPGVLGIHLEGPFLAPERRGIHNADKFQTPDAADVALLSSLMHGKTLVTLAPERVPQAVLRELIAHGVVVAVGHSAADYATTAAALAAGVRGVTHLFNAMTPLQSREPGVIGAALEDRSSWCGVIIDGQHVHPAALRVALAAKPRGKLFLVTDAMPPVGSAQPEFLLNGETISCAGGRCVNADGVLAGSCLDMASAVRNAIEQLHVSVAEAARMASTYPAGFLGLERSHGRIAPGHVADFVVLNEAIAVRETWIGGQRVFVR
jgi:N-acetylglucosamine-6-phosphate deacetylase